MTTPSTPCCELCRDYRSWNNEPGVCRNPSCPCHTPTTESSTNPKKPVDGRWEVNANPTPEGDWREEVFKLSNKIWNMNSKHSHNDLDDMIHTAFSQTIQTEREKAYKEGKKDGAPQMGYCNGVIEIAREAERSRIVGIAEEMMVGWKGDVGTASMKDGHEALTQLITRIKE